MSALSSPAAFGVTEEEPDRVLQHLREVTLGEYEIKAQLGRGGMATVYLAHDIALDRKVAIKVMAPELLYGSGMAERFKREARTAAGLAHPHIIPIYAVGQKGDLLYFVMKYVEGRPLDSVIKELQPLPLGMVQVILSQVCAALAHAHRRGIIHRDVKPANIMIDTDGFGVLTDFGIAKVSSADGLTATGMAIGTASYMSPEQAGALEVTGASDQYSLGVVAYEMLCGRGPFVVPTLMGLLYAHMHDPPPPIRSIRPDCPEELESLVLRMLAKAPADRWPDLDVLVDALSAMPLLRPDAIRTNMMTIARTGLIRPVPFGPSTPVSPVPRGRIGLDLTRTVQLSPREARLRVGQSATLKVVLKNAQGIAVTGRPLTWGSSDEGVVVVTSTGEVQGVGPGAASVSATCDGVTATVAVRVLASERGGKPGVFRWLVAGTALLLGAVALWRWQPWSRRVAPSEPLQVVALPVGLVRLEPASTTLRIGDSVRLGLTVLDTLGRPLNGRTATWRSEDPGVATVNETGMIHGIGAGSGRILVEVDGREGRADLSVVAAELRATRVGVTPADTTVSAGTRIQFRVAVTGEAGVNLAGRTLRWSSSAPLVVSVDSMTGVVLAKQPGQASVMVRTEEGLTASARLAVTALAVRVEFDRRELTLTVGDSNRPALRVADGRGRALSDRHARWSTDRPTVVAVDPGTGRLLALKEGSAEITATVDSQVALLRVTVSRPGPTGASVAAITIAPRDTSVTSGITVSLSAVPRDRSGAVLDRDILWQSGNPQVASVDSKGMVTARDPGRVRILASAEGRSDSVLVTVLAKPDNPPPTAESAAAGGLMELAAGGASSCAVLEGGQAFCWGGEQPGGAVAAGGMVFEKLVVGGGFQCGLSGDGGIYCWGSNSQGQLGDGTGKDRPTPVPVDLKGQLFTDLTAGDAHVCGLTGDGTAFCWGANRTGQLGDGSRSNRNRPVKVQGNLSFQSISAGSSHSCAITRGEKAYCWGDGFSHQLGNSRTNTALEPEAVITDLKFKIVAVGRKHSCGLTDVGHIYCWGENTKGQLGNGIKDDRDTPDSVYTDLRFVSLSAGNAHTCGLAAKGQIFCWGDDALGQLGDGGRESRNLPVAVQANATFRKVTAGAAHTCGLTAGGQVYCWGANSRGQLGTGAAAQFVSAPALLRLTPRASP